MFCPPLTPAAPTTCLPPSFAPPSAPNCTLQTLPQVEAHASQHFLSTSVCCLSQSSSLVSTAVERICRHSCT